MQKLERERDARVDAAEYDEVVERLDVERRAMHKMKADFETFKEESQEALSDRVQLNLEMRQQLNDVTQELDELNGTLAEKDAELATLTSGPRPGRPNGEDRL